MKKLIVCLFVVLLILLCTACTTPTYTVEGEIVDLECNDSGKFHSSYVKLDNGVTYNDTGLIGCKTEKGVNVSITHNDDLRVIEFIVEGTVKNGTE